MIGYDLSHTLYTGLFISENGKVNLIDLFSLLLDHFFYLAKLVHIVIFFMSSICSSIAPWHWLALSIASSASLINWSRAERCLICSSFSSAILISCSCLVIININ